MSKDLLAHLEKVHENYIVVEKIPMEDKILAAHEEDTPRGLAPWQVSEIVQEAIKRLPIELGEYNDEVFDIMYEAVSEALDSSGN